MKSENKIEELKAMVSELDQIFLECKKEIDQYGSKDAHRLLSNIYYDTINMLEQNEYIHSEKKMISKLTDKRNEIAVKRNLKGADLDNNVLPGVLAADAYAFAGIGLSSLTFEEFLSKTIVMLTGTLGMYAVGSRAYVSKGNKYRMQEKDMTLKSKIEMHREILMLLIKCREFYEKIIIYECEKFLSLEKKFTTGWTVDDLYNHIFKDIESGDYKERANSNLVIPVKQRVKIKPGDFKC